MYMEHNTRDESPKWPTNTVAQGGRETEKKTLLYARHNVHIYVCMCVWVYYLSSIHPFFFRFGVRATAQLPRTCSKKKRNNTHALHMPTLSFIYIFCDGHFVLFDDFLPGYTTTGIMIHYVILYIQEFRNGYLRKKIVFVDGRVLYMASAVCIQYMSILLCGVVIKTILGIYIQHVYKPHIVYYTRIYVWTDL